MSRDSVRTSEAPFGNGDILDANMSSEFGKLATVISDTVFRYLNDGKTVVYHGESEHTGGNGGGANPPQDVSLTIRWNGQEENFVLKP